MAQQVTNKSTNPYEYYIICDGGNDKRGCYGSYIVYQGDIVVAEVSQEDYPELSTNNEAEYVALIKALEGLFEVAGPYANVLGISDSELMINQILGYFVCDAPNLVPLRRQALELLNRNNNWYLVHISGRVMKRILGH